MAATPANRILSKVVKDQVNYAVIGTHMKDLRKRCGYTQGHMADRMGVSLNFYASLENGKNQINLSRLLQFSALMDINVNELVAGAYAGPKKNISAACGIEKRTAFDSLLDQCSEELLATMYELCHVTMAHSNQFTGKK